MKNEQYDKILNTLERLGLPVKITDEDKDCDPLAVINSELIKFAVEQENTTFDNRFRLSKMPEATFLRDYYDNADRNLDSTLLKDLMSLNFMKNEKKENIVLWGSAGTGKTWIAELIATEACRKGKRVRWTTFPSMYRELETLKDTNSAKFESMLTYYSRFDLLCIDEFLNYKLDDPFLMQELFDRIRLMKRCSLIICCRLTLLTGVRSSEFQELESLPAVASSNTVRVCICKVQI